MFLAGSIKRYINEGSDVYVVMVTDGGASIIRDKLNSKKTCEPSVVESKEKKQKFFLTKVDFATARNKEFFSSIKSLGVKEDHILFANSNSVEASKTPRYKDGVLTKELAREIIEKNYKEKGGSIYVTLAVEKKDAKHHIYSPHRDHKNLSKGLEEFPFAIIKKFFSESPTKNIIVLSRDEMHAKKRALEQYKICKPEIGRYAIGNQSVNNLLNEWSKKHVEFLASP